jgi:hypothetical protein
MHLLVDLRLEVQTRHLRPPDMSESPTFAKNSLELTSESLVRSRNIEAQFSLQQRPWRLRNLNQLIHGIHFAKSSHGKIWR